MSGHSKWSQIKHKKAVADARRGALFGKFARAISVAARGNPDPSTNLHLKAEIDRARTFNMPSENVERALRKTASPSESSLSEFQAEFIGPGGVGILAFGITDNLNRTLTELKVLASRLDVRPAGLGAVAWGFRRVGLVRFPAPEDAVPLELAAIDAGAEDVQRDGSDLVAMCPPDRLSAVAGLSSASEPMITMVPSASVVVSLPDAEKARSFIDALESHDDVQDVYTNLSEP